MYHIHNLPVFQGAASRILPLRLLRIGCSFLKSLFIIRRYILKIILVLQRVRALLQGINGIRLAVVNGFPFVFLISILRF